MLALQAEVLGGMSHRPPRPDAERRTRR